VEPTAKVTVFLSALPFPRRLLRVLMKQLIPRLPACLIFAEVLRLLAGLGKTGERSAAVLLNESYRKPEWQPKYKFYCRI